MKTLFLMEDLCYGGTQRQSLELAARLDRARFSPVVLSLSGECDLEPLAAAAGVPVHHLGRSRRAAPFFFARLGAAIRRLAPDVIIPCTALPNIWGRLWGKALGIPVLGTVRGGGAPARQHERFLWPLAAHLVCNSRPLAEIMRKLGAPERRLSFIANGVDADRFSPGGAPPSSREQLIVCVARLAKDKDHQTLLRAFAAVAPQFPAARLRLAGEGPEEEKLRRVAASLGPEAASRIEFVGSVAEPAPHYRAARIFVLPSIREGMPNALMEAMASGAAACASAVGGIPDLLDGCGLLFQPGDADGLAAHLATLLADDALADGLAARAREKIAGNYSFEAMTRAHEEILLKIASGKRRAPH